MDTLAVHQVFERLSQNIKNCSNLLQLEATERLLDLFRKQQAHPELHEKLALIFAEKANDLHYFEWKQFRDLGAEAA
jgi:predicted DNA-binding protein YlxM (UPF0122 family)